MLCGQFTSRACRLFRRPRDTPRQRPQGSGQSGSHRAAGLGVVLVSSRLARRGPGTNRRLALGRAHELQGHHEHSAGPDEGIGRAFRRPVERLHLDRSDDLSRNGRARRARPAAFHRSRAYGQRPLRAGRLRVRAHGHHLGAAGRRERSRSAAGPGSHGDGVSRPYLSPSHDWLAVGFALHVARRSLRALPPLLHPQQRDARRRRRHRAGRRAAPCRANHGSDPVGTAPTALVDRRAAADRGAPGGRRARRGRRRT